MQKLKKIKAIETANKKKLLKLFPKLTEDSGIYILFRFENEFKFAYVGQAKHILTRLAQHMSGHQHIDLSIKKHGWLTDENISGWRVIDIKCPEDELDKKEQEFIKLCAKAGYQLRNKTAGGQFTGKRLIDEIKPAKGYYDGLKQGFINAQKLVSKLFEKNLKYLCRDNEPSVNQQKAKQKFEEFLRRDNGNN